MKRGSQDGYVLLTVVLLVALMVSLVTTYSRDAVLANKQGVNEKRMVIETMLDSGLAYANQSLKNGRTGTGTLDSPSGDQLTVNVIDAGSGRFSIEVTTNSQGFSQLLSALAEVHLSDSDELPTLTDAARTVILASPSLIAVTSDTVYSDQLITGVLLVSEGVKVTLRDVVLQGAVVSENAMSDDPFGAAISIEFEQSVVIESSALLADCAIVAPDGLVSLGDSTRLQSNGVIVAETFGVADSSSRATLRRELVAGQTSGLTASILQMGTGRGPLPWPPVLKSGSQGISRLLFDPNRATTAEKNAIKAFTIAGYTGS